MRLTIARKLRIFKVYLINLQNPSHYVKRSCSLRGKQFFVIVNFKKWKLSFLAFNSNKWANFKKRRKIKFLWHTNITLIMQKLGPTTNKTKVFMLSTTYKSTGNFEMICVYIWANIFNIPLYSVELNKNVMKYSFLFSFSFKSLQIEIPS